MDKMSDRIRFVADKYVGGNISKLSERLGLRQSTVHNYAVGRTPSVDFLLRLKNIFGVDPTWVLTGEGDIRGDSGVGIDIPTLVHSIYVARSSFLEAGREDDDQGIAQAAAKIYRAMLPEVLEARRRADAQPDPAHHPAETMGE